jgi:hypothetical protein
MPQPINISQLESYDSLFAMPNTHGEPLEDLVDIEARIALYDSPIAAPRIDTLTGTSVSQFMGDLPAHVYQLSHDLGGRIPFTVIKEITDNYIHADFSEIVISVSNEGNVLSFSDQGMGIADIQSAFLPGYTSANKKMKKYIRGVGSGLCIAREFMEGMGGSLQIARNMGRGCVVTLSLGVTGVDNNHQRGVVQETMPAPHGQFHRMESTPAPSLPHTFSMKQSVITKREDSVLALFSSYDCIGPTIVKDELGLSLATACRTLTALEEAALVISTTSKKRVLTDKGYRRLQQITSR